MRSRKQRFESIPELSMTPMIDVAFTLLIVFILCSNAIIHHNIKVSLPKGQLHEVKEKTKNTIVSLDKFGKFYFNGETVTKQGLFAKIKKLAEDETVFIQADEIINYGSVVELVEEIKKNSGVKRVALTTKKASCATVRA